MLVLLKNYIFSINISNFHIQVQVQCKNGRKKSVIFWTLRFMKYAANKNQFVRKQNKRNLVLVNIVNIVKISNEF